MAAERRLGFLAGAVFLIAAAMAWLLYVKIDSSRCVRDDKNADLWIESCTRALERGRLNETDTAQCS